MSGRTNLAHELRDIKEPHYNCTQVVLISFCDKYNLSKEMAYQLGNHFGGGMRRGSVCGAITGALMAMGLLNRSSDEIKQFMIDFETKKGDVHCAKLLENVSDKAIRSDMCKDYICYCIEYIEKMLGEAN